MKLKVMTYNEVEREVIGLCIALEAVNGMANAAMLQLRDVSSFPGECEVYFHTHIHKELFLIRLLDFAKESGDSKLTGVSGSCLQVLQSACMTCSFDHNGSIAPLSEAVSKLVDWLSYQTLIKLWLPTLDIDAEIEVSRLDFLSISGNQCKHNLSRLTGVSKCIHSILENNGYTVPIEQIPLALEDFSEHLQEDYFIYYGTWLAELLNNIRWGLQCYLRHQFLISHKKANPEDFKYWYEYPDEIQHDIPRQWFWRLLNHIRSGPYMKPFTGAHHFKEQSSLE